METNRTIILTHSQIEKKIERMAWEIFENNYNSPSIVLLGIAQNGILISNAIAKELRKISQNEILTGTLEIDKKGGFDSDINLICKHNLENQSIVIVDDVINTGKTMLAAMLPIVKQKPYKIQTAVLAKRNHRMFPIKCNIVGISLATTLQEHIWFEVDSKDKMIVFLT